jgi:hypothetical protein
MIPQCASLGVGCIPEAGAQTVPFGAQVVEPSAGGSKVSFQLQNLIEIDLDALLPDDLPDLVGVSPDEIEIEH